MHSTDIEILNNNKEVLLFCGGLVILSETQLETKKVLVGWLPSALSETPGNSSVVVEVGSTNQPQTGVTFFIRPRLIT